MPYVLLCSLGKNKNLTEALTSALTFYGGVQLFSSDTILKTSKNPKFNLCSTLSLPNVSNLKGVVIFDDRFKATSKKDNCNCLIPVLHSQNKKAISQLKGSNTAVITCGTSSRDTLSLASIEENRAIISLQRDITDIYGNIFEPMDITVNLKKERGVYPTLAACAALLLCGIDPSGGYSF